MNSLQINKHKVRKYLSMCYNSPKTLETFKKMVIGYFPEIGMVSVRENDADDTVEILYNNERKDFEADIELALIGMFDKQK